MAVSFDRTSASITTEFQHAKPDCFLENSQRVHFHLTTGFNKDQICKRDHGPAITAGGDIKVSTTANDFRGWNFGFIQVAKLNNSSTFFAGRTPKEGAISIQAHIPPAMTTPLVLDGTSAADPWIRYGLSGYDDFKLTSTSLHSDMSDNPSSCASKIMKNDETKCDNLLFHHIKEYELWTTLCARDPLGKIMQFAHFHWVVRWDQKFVWRGRAIMKAASSSFIKDDHFENGPSTVPAVKALVDLPADPVANVAFNSAEHNVQKNSPNRLDQSDWFLNVPPDFFRP